MEKTDKQKTDETEEGGEYKKQEAQLPQWDIATRYVSKFVICFTSYGSYKGLKQQNWPSMSFKALKGIGNDAIRLATYDFLLVFHWNYVSILHRFRDIITFSPKYKKVTWLWTHLFWE